ncbi:hypothetical protein GCM10023211_14580 [Orbus sasakiae]|uniref:Uncharacterized protein n=1 Tax=Orbus sasakiae TaxID=1078475 RepID=A0ABP9N5R1_9GAMM
MLNNKKPELIIPTGGAFVLDESYQGSAIQIGGTKPNVSWDLNTYLYIKLAGYADTKYQNKYVKVTVPADQKVVLFTTLASVSFDQNNQIEDLNLPLQGFALDALDEPKGLRTESSDAIDISISYNKTDGWSRMTSLAEQQSLGSLTIEIVDQPFPTFVKYLVENGNI